MNPAALMRGKTRRENVKSADRSLNLKCDTIGSVPRRVAEVITISQTMRRNNLYAKNNR